MRIESIVIKNYRQYKDLHFEFPKTKDTDLHVIVASNGIGKTNLMAAIIWYFYGIEPNIDKSSKTFPLCNLKALDEARDKGELFADVSVKISVSANNEAVIFTRSAKINAVTQFEQKSSFEVQVTGASGETDFLEGEFAAEQVDKYVPLKIRQYFFFDGEQLHNYFGPAQDTTHVKDSIYEIAQINMVKSAIKHLEKLVSEYRSTIAKKNPKMKEITDQIDAKKKERDIRLDDIEELGASNRDAGQRITELTTLIGGAESVVEDTRKYDANNERITGLQKEIEKCNNDLLDLVRQYYVLLAMYPVNKRTSDYIADKDVRGKLPPDIDIELIRSSMRSHICAICNQKFSEDSDAEKHMEELLDRYEISTEVSNKLSEIKNDVSRAVVRAHKYMDEKERILSDIKTREKELQDLEETNSRLVIRIRACSSAKQVADWIEERNQLTDAIRRNDQKIGSYKEMVRRFNDELADLEKQEKKAVDDMKELEAIKKYKTFAEDALRIMTSIEEEIISDVKAEMESETMSLFDELVWKKNTYGHIEFDDNFKLNLYSKEGISCIDSTSAAERELLALAFTIALHRVSGHDSPLFIDTPVGRVSDDNRINFARTLVEVSTKKQIVLALTPSEYSEEIRGLFNNTTLSSRAVLSSINEEATVVEETL